MYDELVKALRGTGIPFEEGAWDKAPAGDYGVYALDGTGETMWADGHMAERAMQGSIDLFARRGPGREQAKKVEAGLNQLGLSWSLNSIQYESERHITHWEWVFEIDQDMEAM